MRPGIHHECNYPNTTCGNAGCVGAERLCADLRKSGQQGNDRLCQHRHEHRRAFGSAKDTVLWRSPTYDFSVRCYQERENTGPEDVYFYLSPDGQGALGSDLEVGINLNGEDLRCSSLPGCRQKIGMHFDGCWTGGRGMRRHGSDQAGPFPDLPLKLAAPTPGKEGPITGVNSYALFQFDGVGGINNLGAGTYVCMPLA